MSEKEALGSGAMTAQYLGSDWGMYRAGGSVRWQCRIEECLPAAREKVKDKYGLFGFECGQGLIDAWF